MSEYYTNAKALALVEVVEKEKTYYEIIDFNKIVSKHDVIKLDIRVLAPFQDGLVRLGVLKSISSELSRLLTYKKYLEDILKNPTLNHNTPGTSNFETNSNVKFVRRLRSNSAVKNN